KPRQVLDKLRTFYETSYANVHRGVYTLSELATAEYEGAREKVARFINAPAVREVIFTRGATESINLVAYAWGLDNLGPGDVVVVTELEHHSNFVPWQYIAKRTGAAFEAMPPFNLGGHMIRSVSLEETTWGQIPFKFEAGTQPIAEAVGFGAAVDYITDVGLDAIEEHERDLLVYALERLAEVPGLTAY